MSWRKLASKKDAEEPCSAGKTKVHEGVVMIIIIIIIIISVISLVTLMNIKT